MPKELKQKVTFNASARCIYDALMNPKTHMEYTGGKARISSKVGGNFSAYDGYISGVNVYLVKDERIVQAWRGSDWPDGVFSIVSYAIEELGPEKCQLTLTQNGVPDEFHDSIDAGWNSYYWKPMKLWLKSEAK